VRFEAVPFEFLVVQLVDAVWVRRRVAGLLT